MPRPPTAWTDVPQILLARRRFADPPPHVAHLGPCWLWTAACDGKGYGTLKVQGRQYQVHQLALLLFRNIDVRADRVLGCHHCDVRACFNPDHLYAGTYPTNTRDRSERNSNLGERNGHAIMTEAQAQEVLDLLTAQGGRFRYGQRAALATRLGVTKSALNLLRTGRNWPHLARRDL